LFSPLVLQVDEHNFEDKELFYRFYADEDKKFKRFWERPASEPLRPARQGLWRFQPHIACNSPFLTIRIADGLHEAMELGQPVMLRAFLSELRRRVRHTATQDAGWRISKYVCRAEGSAAAVALFG
jgi:hypothetical protein